MARDNKITILLDDDELALIKGHAERNSVPPAVFIRSAAIKEVRKESPRSFTPDD